MRLAGDKAGATPWPVAQALQAAVEHHQGGRASEAEAIYRRVLQVEPNNPDALHLLGVMAHQAGNSETALSLIRKAIRANPSDASFHYNLGHVLQGQGKLEEAAAAYRKALSLNPDHAVAHNNLGNVLRGQGKLEESAASYRKALSIQPDYAVAHNNLGNVLQDHGKLEEAAAAYRKALSLKPDHAVYNSLGKALRGQGKLEEAAAAYHQALSLKPDYAESHCNLGNALQDQGKLEEAAAAYRKAVAFKPDYISAHSILLCLHGYTRDLSPESERCLAAQWENLVLSESERAAARNRTRSFRSSALYAPRAGRKLRVGIVSAELGQHSVAEFLEPFLEQVDRNRFHITLFPTDVRPEPRAARLNELADEFEPLAGVSDNMAADRIRSDRIDVLIDTTGHTKGCRLGIFAHRAAPVQCHYIGYFGTTGLTEMDWFIADEVLLPSRCDAHFREGIWRLPRLWLSYRADTSLPDSRWTPSPDGAVWLGTFNSSIKVRRETLGLWAKVMNALPESRLLLKDRRAIAPSVQERITTALLSHGISQERVHFAGWTPDWHSHMTSYDKLDIALDTIPLNSGTTAFDALWMGVPIVALEGDWMGGRMTTAMLSALGKPEWVAQSEDEYVSIVAALARDAEGRKAFRPTQRALMAASPLCDAKGMARSLEDAFEAMFDRWLGGERS